MKAPNVVNQEYHRTGSSKRLDELGMRQMQARAYKRKDSQYLLIKSPPASGKSRALMFLALDKLRHQGVKKVIVAVPEMSIGRSFRPTELKKHGFFDDWLVEDKYNLCLLDAQSSSSKTRIFEEFVTKDLPADTPHVLVCTHATFRYGFQEVMENHNKDISLFNDFLLGIDEFHHVSADESNVLGSYIDQIMSKTNAHVIAMTGSYFRGDTVPILSEEDEAKFDRVTYTYYEQLNGYEYLKTLGIGYNFYSGSYFDVLPDCLDTTLKTIVYIPYVNSQHSEHEKTEEANRIIDIIGKIVDTDGQTGIHTVKTKDGRLLKVADLVLDDAGRRSTQKFLANIKHPDDVDIIIALGMAKEGFDWEYCEHVLTIGYRNSLTEVVQIIGRATRDSEGKEHAQFTNLISLPDASKESTTKAVNDILKAISLSLLMEQVLKPKINFRRRGDGKGKAKKGDIFLEGLSDEAVEFLNESKDEIINEIMNNEKYVKEFVSAGERGEESSAVSDVIIPEIIRKKNPNLTEEEILAITDKIKVVLTANTQGGIKGKEDIPDDAEIEGEKSYVKTEDGYVDKENLSEEEQAQYDESDYVKERHLPEASKVYNPNTKEESKSEGVGQAFIKNTNKYINVANLPVNLIDSVNPFHDAYNVISKTIDEKVLLNISDSVRASRSGVTEAEVLSMWDKLKEFIRSTGRKPSHLSSDPTEVRLAQIMEWARNKKAKGGV